MVSNEREFTATPGSLLRARLAQLGWPCYRALSISSVMRHMRPDRASKITDQLALSSSILPLCYSCSNSLTPSGGPMYCLNHVYKVKDIIFQSEPLAYASGRRVDLKNENVVTSDLSVSHCIGWPGSALLRNTIQIYHQLYITIKKTFQIQVCTFI